MINNEMESLRTRLEARNKITPGNLLGREKQSCHNYLVMVSLACTIFSNLKNASKTKKKSYIFLLGHIDYDARVHIHFFLVLFW